MRKPLYKGLNRYTIKCNSHKKREGKNMSVILGISVILVSISIGLAYLSYNFANSDEANIVNEIQVKYPNKINFYG